MDQLQANGQPQPAMPPRRKSKLGWIVVVVMVLLPFGIVAAGLSQFWWPQYQQEQIKKIGIKTTAKITAIEPTNKYYNNQPQVLVTLLVHPMQGADFTAQTKMVVNPVYLPQIQPGTSVTVYYDPADRSRIAIE